jgi:hypothetical protein
VLVNNYVEAFNDFGAEGMVADYLKTLVWWALAGLSF